MMTYASAFQPLCCDMLLHRLVMSGVPWKIFKFHLICELSFFPVRHCSATAHHGDTSWEDVLPFLCLSCGVTGFITCSEGLSGVDSGGSRWLIITAILMPTDPVAASPLVHVLQLGGSCPFTAGMRFASSFQSLCTLHCWKLWIESLLPWLKTKHQIT